MGLGLGLGRALGVAASRRGVGVGVGGQGDGAVAAGRGFGVVGDEGDRGRASARDGAQEREDAEPIGRGEGGYPEKSLPLRAARRWGLGAD